MKSNIRTSKSTYITFKSNIWAQKWKQIGSNIWHLKMYHWVLPYIALFSEFLAYSASSSSLGSIVLGETNGRASAQETDQVKGAAAEDDVAVVVVVLHWVAAQDDDM